MTNKYIKKFYRGVLFFRKCKENESDGYYEKFEISKILESHWERRVALSNIRKKTLYRNAEKYDPAKVNFLYPIQKIYAIQTIH